ncbi:lysylphosphatidylglycerol synthase domain-containing protein [Gloeocapsa sp. PCC 73106]|uniref:lysylphosphatidylglycerol synthase transmembrane domain-containing protein n=1 Tax=Gloeocapsa sp. PCC 73106 TaxID=102232 RepID=UPI0002AC5420|nr:lysylphosphatidylglycerol synthase domain-containing protein [Gloeocapsa sp. PCC 73106]ELR99881.1 putative integral membrane protein [Gloeocapsa sp. PCC 73106]
MKQFKPYLRWIIVGATVFFLLKTLKNNWQEVTHVTLEPQGWSYLAIALLVTLLAHIWSGLVWGLILRTFQQPLTWFWALRVYLTTNVAKYLPGNIWHFYGRINAVVKAGGNAPVATVTVLLEPLLMASAALLMAIFSGSGKIWLQLLGLIGVLIAIHPWFLNRLIRYLSRLKGNYTEVTVKSYPWQLLLGEWGFVFLRGIGFVMVVAAFTPIILAQVPYLLSVFSLAWLLGLIVPGAPGGLGVFEATAIAALNSSQFPYAMVLAIVAVFRLISILAEAIAALLAAISFKPN